MQEFVSFLASEGLKHRTIKTYFAGVRFLHIRSDPFLSHMPRLDYRMKGVEPEKDGGQRTRLPMTPRDTPHKCDLCLCGVAFH